MDNLKHIEIEKLLSVEDNMVNDSGNTFNQFSLNVLQYKVMGWQDCIIIHQNQPDTPNIK